MVMVSPEMDPTICWLFEAEIVLLFHAKTFHKGFQVTVHVGNVRQTAIVVAVHGKVSFFMVMQSFMLPGKLCSASLRPKLSNVNISYYNPVTYLSKCCAAFHHLLRPCWIPTHSWISVSGPLAINSILDAFSVFFPINASIYDLITGRAEDRGEGGGSLQVHQAPRIPEGGGQAALQRGCDQRYRPCH